jgi:protein JSN1
MLEKVAPHLASIGVHKNGTWAAQKIIDKSCTDTQVRDRFISVGLCLVYV